MYARTDLAIESNLQQKGGVEGVFVKEKTENGIKITTVDIKTEHAAKKLSKRVGRYVTFDVGDIAAGLTETDGAASIIAEEIKNMVGDFNSALVIGVGNPNLTADALGPKTADGVLATRHLKKDFLEHIGLTGLKSVAVLSPGVLGKTGMEAVEIIKSVAKTAKPDVVIAVDALASADNERIGHTVQLSNTGISPGSGIGNKRREISEDTLSLPVIALGVPTVADFHTENRSFIVTMREIDLLTNRAAELLSHALNFALQPNIERDVLLSLV